MAMYGFTVQNWRAKGVEALVNLTHAGMNFTLSEDSYAFDEQRKIACVADGISRDFLDGSVVTRKLKDIPHFLNLQYPSPSHATEAAEICVRKFLETKSLGKVNPHIWEYSLQSGLVPTNHLDKDLAGCTAAGFWTDGRGTVHYQSIGDSRIAIFDKDGKLRLKTPNEGPNSKGSIDEDIKKKYDTNFEESKGRRIIRSLYRNNPREPLAYGALTGEPNALKYIRKGKEKLNAGDYVLAFTDGVGDIIFPRDNIADLEGINLEFLIRVVDGSQADVEKYCKERVSTEGTLVVYRTE